MESTEPVVIGTIMSEALAWGSGAVWGLLTQFNLCPGFSSANTQQGSVMLQWW